MIMNFFVFLVGSALASDLDYVRIESGEIAPMSGVLLTEDALAQIIAQNEREVAQCKIDSEFALSEMSANKDLKYDLLDVRYKSETQMYLDMIAVRDEQIASDKKKDVLQKWKTYGSFILGAGTTIGITYAVSQNFN